MKYEDIRSKVDEVFSRCEQLNRRAGFKKFHPFSSFRGGKLFEYGVYNYENKKYVHCYSQSIDSDTDVKELSDFVK